ncbi:MAG: hypothetical protein BWY63_02886 [Chloroflexi bacterium ADurb.Bin360]|jgi:predicted transcriptional regulator|nr:MAG: hypothetical protein BWY63_02886 [Chloroflexi bacterium ADurb.Bin360]
MRAMKTKEAIDRAGSTNALAALLEVTPSAVSQWGENLPKAREWQLRLLKPKWFREEDARAKALAASIKQQSRIKAENAAA